MKLWTIQNIEAYKKFKNTGFLHADEKFIYDDMIFHYNWMVKQMKKRIGPPPSREIKYPVWAWYQWNKKQKARFKIFGTPSKGYMRGAYRVRG